MRSRDLGGFGLNIGLGYRPAFRDVFFGDSKPEVSWLEVISENYFSNRGCDTRARQTLRKLRVDFPVAMHGIGLNLASTDPLDERYLSELLSLEREIEPWLVTDHLCWTGVNRQNLFDLLPFPYTKSTLTHVAGRVKAVQDLLRRPIALENLTYYLKPAGNEMSEAQFLNELCGITGCKILLDVNNVYVNSINFSFDPVDFLSELNLSRVVEVHLAGHSEGRGGLLIDTHGAPIKKDVWSLYEWLVGREGLIPTMIERDQHFPAWSELEAELGYLKEIRGRRGADERFSKSVASPLS